MFISSQFRESPDVNASERVTGRDHSPRAAAAPVEGGRSESEAALLSLGRLQYYAATARGSAGVAFGAQVEQMEAGGLRSAHCEEEGVKERMSIFSTHVSKCSADTHNER